MTADREWEMHLHTYMGNRRYVMLLGILAITLVAFSAYWVADSDSSASAFDVAKAAQMLQERNAVLLKSVSQLERGTICFLGQYQDTIEENDQASMLINQHLKNIGFQAREDRWVVFHISEEGSVKFIGSFSGYAAVPGKNLVLVYSPMIKKSAQNSDTHNSYSRYCAIVESAVLVKHEQVVLENRNIEIIFHLEKSNSDRSGS